MEKIINFSSNLKYYRKKHKLTQQELAQRLGYTEKSISKWEGGYALPTLELVIRLSEIFGVSLDELVFKKSACNYFLGIDGGGTKTVFKLIEENGFEINKIYKGSCNPNDIGIENATALLKDSIAEVCRGIPYSQITMFAGISGGGLTGNNARILNRFFGDFGFFAFDNGSDVENLVSLSDYEKCILIIMGTGFILYVLDGDKRQRISGWGQFFDEGGSGYTIGRDAITAALCELDKSGEKTLITPLLEERLGESAEAHLSRFYQGSKRYIAEFSDLVFKAAMDNDKKAIEILEKNMEFVAKKINTAIKCFDELSDNETIPVLVAGGISTQKEILFPMIERHITGAKCNFIRLEDEPVEGALRRAKKIFDLKMEEGKV